MRWVAILGATCLCALVAYWWRAAPNARSSGERAVLDAPPPRRNTAPPPDSSPTRRWSIRVNVSTPGGSPRAGATVQFLDAGDGQELDSTTTDHRGIAKMNLIGGGRIAVTQVAPFYPYTSPMLEPVSQELEVVLRGGELSIAGRVIDSDGREAEAVVAVQPEATRQFVGRIVAVPSGFRIEGLCSGRHRVVVRLRQGIAKGQVPSVAPVVESGDTDVVIRLKPAAKIEFQLHDVATGELITEPRRVRVFRAGEQVWIARASGPIGSSLWAKLEPGKEYELEARADGYEASLRTRFVAQPGREDRRIDLRPDPGQWGEVRVRLEDPEGVPLDTAVIMRLDADGSGGGTSYKPVEDEYRMRLPAGHHRLKFGPNIFAKKKRPLFDQEWSFELKRGVRLQKTIRLAHGGWLRQPRWDGRGLAVNLVREGSKEAHQLSFFGAGGYGPALVRPGKYQVSARIDADRTVWGEVEIRVGETHEVELRTVR